jgi:carboxyl-terminal processing protease
MLRVMDEQQPRPDGTLPGTIGPDPVATAGHDAPPTGPANPGPAEVAPPAAHGTAGAAPRAGGGVSRAGILGLILGGLLLFFVGIGIGRLGDDQVAFLASPSPAATPAATPSATPRPTPAPGTPKADFGLAQEAWDILYREYVDRGSLDPVALEQGAVRGMVEAVGDTGHTVYLSPDEAQTRNLDLSGQFVGIGVVVDERDGYVEVLRVLPDSPALRGGVAAGDRIVAVDGKTVVGQTVDEVARVIRGPAGTQVRVTVQAPGGAERELTMTRQQLDLPLASWAMVPGSTTAMVRLESFAVGSADALVSALKEARAAGATEILFDLRGNGGGYTDQAISVASQFLKSGLVYRAVDKDGKEYTYDVKPGGVATDLPLVVLVDGQTASSAEIVAGALQDAGRAKLVGDRTSGTGTVLGSWSLSDGSQVYVGIQRWLTPDGSSIWKEGITPDQAVSLPSGVGIVVPDDLAGLGATGVAAAKDNQLQAGLTELRSEARN